MGRVAFRGIVGLFKSKKKMLKEYNLPEWAFLDANSHLGNPLENRTVINHIRSASIIEIIDRDKDGFMPVESVIIYEFEYAGPAGTERMSAVLHYCATLDKVADKDLIINEILRPCAKWYCDYCTYEDNNLIVSSLN